MSPYKTTFQFSGVVFKKSVSYLSCSLYIEWIAREIAGSFTTLSGTYVILVFLDIAILTITITGVGVCDSKGLRMKCTGIGEGERGGERNHIMWNFRHVLFTKYYTVQEIKENDVCFFISFI